METPKHKGEIVRIEKANAILKFPVKIFFRIKYTYDTNQTDKSSEQKLSWEATVISKLKKIWNAL